jgi:hypothetical protein
MASKKLLVVASLAALALAGCETSDDRTLAQGQACLDSATSATAAQCKTLVAGLTSQESYMIRCSADFIAQDFTGTRIASSISQMKNGSGTTNGTTSMIAYLVFTKNTTPTANLNDADTAISDCTAAGSRSMLRLATATKLATTIASAGHILGSIDPTSATAATQLQNAVNNLANGTTTISSDDLTSLGNTAILANQAYCGDGSSYVGTDVCNNLSAAVSASSDPQAIAQALLNQMKK